MPKVWSLVSNNDQDIPRWDASLPCDYYIFRKEGSRVVGYFLFFWNAEMLRGGGGNRTFIFLISRLEAFKGLKQRVFFFHGI